ncbi:MAG: hypothetical protein U1F25_01770 [Rubrivivax sp.]
MLQAAGAAAEDHHQQQRAQQAGELRPVARAHGAGQHRQRDARAQQAWEAHLGAGRVAQRQRQRRDLGGEDRSTGNASACGARGPAASSDTATTAHCTGNPMSACFSLQAAQAQQELHRGRDEGQQHQQQELGDAVRHGQVAQPQRVDIRASPAQRAEVRSGSAAG